MTDGLKLKKGAWGKRKKIEEAERGGRTRPPSVALTWIVIVVEREGERERESGGFHRRSWVWRCGELGLVAVASSHIAIRLKRLAPVSF